MGNVPQAEAIETAEKLLEELNGVEAALKKEQLELDDEIKAATRKRAPVIDPLVATRERLVTALVELYDEHRAFLTEGTGKTVTLRGGTLSSRLSQVAVVIDDEAAAERHTRRKGKVRTFMKRDRWKFDKNALKKDPDFVNGCPGMHLERAENLTIKLPKAQSEIIRKLAPLRGLLGKKA